MRRFIVFAVAMMVSLGFAAEAEAGKKKGGEEAAAEDKGAAEPLKLNVESGIASVDDLFKKAQAPFDNINNAKMKLDAVPGSLNTALGLPAGTPFKDAVADLKTKADGKVKIAMDGAVPKLSLEDGVPDNVKTAVDALNMSMNDAVAAVGALAEVPAQVQEVIAAAKSFDPKSIKPPTAIPKATGVIAGNLKALTAAPEEVKGLIESLDGIKNELTAGFGA